MGIFQKPALNLFSKKKRNIPEGLWHKCPACGEVSHELQLSQNLRVCPKCSYHFLMNAMERIDSIVTKGTFVERDETLGPVDALQFKGPSAYSDRLENYQKRTGMRDAIVTGTGKLEEREIALGVMDFRFLAASMGSVVGEKVTRIIEHATENRLPVILFCAAGGARVHEGAFGLMQMAKSSGALAMHKQMGLPYISVLTHPTTGGVTASFATLGDVIVAEPRAMVGFAGPRVIKETTHQDLPSGFQTAEFLEEHGLIDIVAPRFNLKNVLHGLLGYMSAEVA